MLSKLIDGLTAVACLLGAALLILIMLALEFAPLIIAGTCIYFLIFKG
jgi:hypothetical protein